MGADGKGARVAAAGSARTGSAPHPREQSRLLHPAGHDRRPLPFLSTDPGGFTRPARTHAPAAIAAGCLPRYREADPSSVVPRVDQWLPRIGGRGRYRAGVEQVRDRASSTPEASVEETLAELIIRSGHPQIASVQLRPSGPEGWCKLRINFVDGSAAYIGTEKSR